ncbi:hypothetical protein AYJ00_10860 [Shewanella algae]|nr:hypothetical protein AYJ00_10860 [Shewanella algae]
MNKHQSSSSNWQNDKRTNDEGDFARLRMWIEMDLHDEIKRLANKNGRAFSIEVKHLLRVALRNHEQSNRK